MGARRSLTGLALAAARTAPARGLAGLLERAGRAGSHALPILTYHRVDDPARRPQLDPALLSTTPDEFERQMAHLAEHRRALSLSELIAIRRGEMELPARAVLVSFDDAYRDFAEHALPVLRRLGVPATVFVPTAYASDRDRRFWWDRLHAALASTSRQEVATQVGNLSLNGAKARLAAHRRLSAAVSELPHDEGMQLVDEVISVVGAVDPGDVVLPWAELRELTSDGVELAAHTRTHPRLDRVPLEQAVEEVRGSLADLERELGSAPPAFAYPQGGHAEPVVEALRNEGVELAFTTARGVNDLRQPDWLRLRRINVGRRSSVGAIRLQIAAAALRPGGAPG